MARKWFKTWIFNREDPTMLGCVVALGFMLFADKPWGWSCCRPSFEDGWISTIWAQAIAVMILSPRGWWRFGGLMLVSVLSAPSVRWSLVYSTKYPLHWLPEWLGFNIEVAQYGVFGAELMLLLMLVGRMQRASRDWLTLMSHASLALSIAFLIWVELELRGSLLVAWAPQYWREERILWFLVPAISIPILFWSLLRTIPVAPRWLASASTILAAVAIRQALRHLTFIDWVILLCIAACGHFAGWMDRLFERQDLGPPGFEVIVSSERQAIQ